MSRKEDWNQLRRKQIFRQTNIHDWGLGFSVPIPLGQYLTMNISFRLVPWGCCLLLWLRFTACIFWFIVVMSSVEGKLDDDDDDICPSYSRNHTLCIQYFSVSLVRSIHSRTVASFLNLHFIREELYNWSDGAQKPLYGDIYLAGFLKTLLPNRLLPSNSFFRTKTISKVAIIKTKSATIAFFSSPPFFLPAFSFSPFLFLHWCDFGAYRA